jgi:group I intron endonuclease
MGEIYKIQNKINKKIYIGQTVSYLSNGKEAGYIKRWEKHKYNSKNQRNNCPLLEKAITKYGSANFNVVLIQKCRIKDLDIWEMFYITKYNSKYPYGYNLTNGGSSNFEHSLITKQKMSESRIGKKHSQYTKNLIASHHQGKIVTEKTRFLIGQKSKYRNIDPNNKEKISKALKTLSLSKLPMYIYYSKDLRNNNDIIVARVPKYPAKKFCRSDSPLEEKITNAIKYIATILNGHRSEEYQIPMKAQGIV